LEESGYERYEVTHFYLKTKKKSRILTRKEPIPVLSGKDTPAIFSIYRSVEDYKGRKNAETVLVVLASDPILSVL
jgi:hypothetical protein